MKGFIVTILIIMVLITALAGCTGAGFNSGEKIVPPGITNTPLDGKWQVSEILGRDFKPAAADVRGQWINISAEFSKADAALGSISWINPSYKVKTVDAIKYFKENPDIEELGEYTKERELLIITITSQSSPSCDFIRLSPEKVVAVLDEAVVFLVRNSDKARSEIEENLKTAGTGINDDGPGSNSSSMHSGVLLGIRSSNKNPGRSPKREYTYKTLWISSDNKSVNPILETPGIFLPRADGFWKLDVKRITDWHRQEDVLVCYPVAKNRSGINTKAVIDPLFWYEREGRLSKALLFAGNDYISVELEGEGSLWGGGEKWSMNELRVMPVEKLKGVRGLKISDFFGETGTEAMKEGIRHAMNISGMQTPEAAGITVDEENFGLFRKTGHWFLKGRYSSKNGGNSISTDYDIKLAVPSSLINYDNASFSWNKLKNRLPQTVDAYASPNKDLMIVVLPGRLLVYGLDKGEMSRSPLKRIRLDPEDAIVMAEWAQGSFVKAWDASFRKNEVKTVEED